MTRLAAIAFAALVLAAACSDARAPRGADDVYIWQRAWTPAVAAAVRERSGTFDTLHVLAGEIEAGGDLVTVKPDARALMNQRVIPVVRVDGSRIASPAQVAQAAADAVARFRSLGADVRGVEIDHDCASSKLGAYARALAQVKAAVAPLPVTITALPSWAPSRDLDDVIAAADVVVLQVHAVDRAAGGLFSSSRARAAIDAFDKHTRAWKDGRGFLVALPAYGSALAVDDDGAVLGVAASEGFAARGIGARVREAWAEPADVASLLGSLRERRPPHFRGVVWFRLPVDGDVRAWSFRTLQAVRAGRGEVRPKLALVRDGPDVVVANGGDVDATAPARVALADVDEVRADAGGARRHAPPPPRGHDARGFDAEERGVHRDDERVVGDGAHGYAFDARSRVWTSSSPPRVRAGERVVIGWARAVDGGGDGRASAANGGGAGFGGIGGMRAGQR